MNSLPDLFMREEDYGLKLTLMLHLFRLRYDLDCPSLAYISTSTRDTLLKVHSAIATLAEDARFPLPALNLLDRSLTRPGRGVDVLRIALALKKLRVQLGGLSDIHDGGQRMLQRRNRVRGPANVLSSLSFARRWLTRICIWVLGLYMAISRNDGALFRRLCRLSRHE